jgi:hypothetical protein
VKSVDKLCKRVTAIVDKCPSLGLRGWEFHISIVDEVAGATRKAAASTSCSTHYDTVWMEFEKDWLSKASQSDIDKTIIHELLHMVFRDLDHQIENVSEFLGEPHKSSFEEAYTHEIEGIIEKMARTLNLHMKDVLQ